MPPIGPSIPAHLLRKVSSNDDNEESSDDDYGPSLPPDIVDLKQSEHKRIVGPSFPDRPPPEDSDEEVGPTPLPANVAVEEESGVEAFLAKEERRRKAIEEDKKPKALKRDEWMLAPPEASDLLGSLHPGKLKARQFQRNTQEKIVDRTLWTETPAERLQRLADEVSGKRKRAEEAAGSQSASEESVADHKRRKRDEEIRSQVEKHNEERRKDSLLDIHAKASQKDASGSSGQPAAIWDRDRDMGLGGRLMDEKKRTTLIQDAKSLGSRFGHSKGGNFL